MPDANLRRENHFVPRVYLKQWTLGNSKIWVYRTLVSHERVPYWKERSISGVAYHEHLYTSVAFGEESDRIEKWLDNSFEAPAESVIRRAVSDSRLTPEDWEILARFVAAQDVRTPARLLENMRRWDESLPRMIEEMLIESVSELEKMRREGTPIPVVNRSKDDYIPLRVSTERQEGPDHGFVKAEVVAGRELWLHSMRHLLTKTIAALQENRWTILKPPEDLTWFTSDDPVVRLNYYGKGSYDFKGGWGNPGTEIFLPLGPRHLLYTKVGTKPPKRGTVLRRNAAAKFRRLIAEHAHRMIFANVQDQLITSLRPRHVDHAAFEREKEEWDRWHSEQSNAETDMIGYGRYSEDRADSA